MARLITLKQYEDSLDEQFSIGNIQVTVARFPDGWIAFNNTQDIILCHGKATKREAIRIVEEITHEKYNPETRKFL